MTSEPNDRPPDSVERRRGADRTYRRILDRAVERFDRDGPGGVVVTQIAREAGVSVGAVYHHFSGRAGLVAAARAEQFRRTTAADIEWIRRGLDDAETFEQFLEWNRRLVRTNRSPERRAARRQRLAVLAAAIEDHETADEVRWAQRQLTDGLTELVERARAQGWFTEDLDARAWAIAVQGLFLGSVLADLDECDDESWVAVVEAIQQVGIRPPGPAGGREPPPDVPTGTPGHH